MTPVFSNKTYDKLKFVALILLPAFAALYFGLAQIWGLPNAEKVVGSATVLDTFLGVLLKLSSAGYRSVGGGTDGDLIVQYDEGQPYLSLGVNETKLAAIPNKDAVTLRVVNGVNTPPV